MNRPILSMPPPRWALATLQADRQLRAQNHTQVRPAERVALTVHLYLQTIHLPREKL